MRTRLVLATALSALVLPALAAPVQAIDGPYIDLGAGYNLVQDVFTHSRLTPQNQPAARTRFGEGFVTAGAVGWGFGNGLRTEIEGAYDYNAVINSVRSAVPARADGNQGTYGVLANVFYDIDLTKLGTAIDWMQPYVGVGAGALWTHFSPITTYAVDNSVTFRTSGTGGPNFAYQGIVGFGFPVDAVPGLKLTADYRFIGIEANSGAVGNAYTPQGHSMGTVGLSPVFLHQFTVGVAYAFNQPAPPPPPAPVYCDLPIAEARTWLVFFDWDRVDLTKRAHQIIADAAQGSTRMRTTRIEVNGYTDLSGTAAYNQELSLRRALLVKAELVRDGVSAQAVEIHGQGENKPRLPTAQGDREQQNRRVEIILVR